MSANKKTRRHLLRQRAVSNQKIGLFDKSFFYPFCSISHPLLFLMLPVTRRRNSNTFTAGLLTCSLALRLPNTLRHQWHRATPSPAPLSGATGTKLTAASTVSDSHRIPFWFLPLREETVSANIAENINIDNDFGILLDFCCWSDGLRAKKVAKSI